MEKKGMVHYLEALDSIQSIGDSIRPNFYPTVSIVGIHTMSSPQTDKDYRGKNILLVRDRSVCNWIDNVNEFFDSQIVKYFTPTIETIG